MQIKFIVGYTFFIKSFLKSFYIPKKKCGWYQINIQKGQYYINKNFQPTMNRDYARKYIREIKKL